MEIKLDEKDTLKLKEADEETRRKVQECVDFLETFFDQRPGGL